MRVVVVEYGPDFLERLRLPIMQKRAIFVHALQLRRIEGSDCVVLTCRPDVKARPAGIVRFRRMAGGALVIGRNRRAIVLLCPVEDGLAALLRLGKLTVR